jgi:hypothetical protein
MGVVQVRGLPIKTFAAVLLLVRALRQANVRLLRNFPLLERIHSHPPSEQDILKGLVLTTPQQCGAIP